MRNMGSSSLPDTLHLCGCLVMSFGNPDSHWYHSFLNFTESTDCITGTWVTLLLRVNAEISFCFFTRGTVNQNQVC